MADRDLSSTDDGADGAEDDAGAEWSSLREMIGAARASGFDEEPSPRIDALLMAAARAHAPRPRVAWWSRLASWMRPLVVHPALAGAAALVIVGGAAGVMYKRGQLSVGPPRLEPTVTAPRQEPAPRPEQQVAPADQPPPPEVPALPSTTWSGVPPEVMQPELPKPPGPRRPARDRGQAPTGAEIAVADAFEEGAGGDGADTLVIAADLAGGPPWEARKNAAPAAADDAREDRGERETIATATAADSAFSARVGAGAPTGAPQLQLEEKPPAPPPSDPSPSDRAENLRDAGGGGSVVVAGSADRRGATPGTKASQLFGQARTAARSGNCVVVRMLSAKVRKLDAAYHRNVFSRDADIAKCL